ncbi:NACHT domain-containing protein [Spirosoma sp. KCTC 42546]|uniref:NACHT domain-containing protein n=1 Tax=Spirosoma sp. KCTC 42546 TaxID=2520506 RepID=UPI001159C33A|nr:NACHT domain-containing protein [Spirosoma sp. KCTC 42546]QDK77720.1 NACHT domain-containing protein [Spirosoma sp. KCTC 42546]
MEATLLKSAAPAIIKEVYQTSSSFLGGIKDEAKQLFSDALSEYLYKYEVDFRLIKTILHRHEPVPFYEIYFPAKLKKREHNKSHEAIVDTQSVNRVFWNTRFVTVTGDAGSGKSTLIKHLFLNCIKEKFGIPILIQLRDLNECSNDLQHFIKEKIINLKLAQNNEILNRLLNAGNFVFLLDGYDEVQAKHKNKVITSINSFVEKYDKNRYLITTRPYSNLEMLPKFHNYYMQDLSEDDIGKFIDLQKIKQNLADKIKQSLAIAKNNYINSYLTNPLLLTLYIVTYSTNSSVPDSKSIFYRRVFEVLYREHDSASKIGFEREFSSTLHQEQFEELLKAFSLITFFDSQYSFDRGYAKQKLGIAKKIAIDKNKNFPNFDLNKVVDDLKTAIGIWVEDSGILSFAHRSMQEYFAASCIESTSSNKEAIYAKIRVRLEYKKNSTAHTYGSDIQNFMSLCKELDKYNYVKYIEIPIIKDLISKLKRRGVNAQLKAVLNIFTSGLVVSNSKEIIDNDEWEVIGYVHPPFKYYMLIEEFIGNLFAILKSEKVIPTQEFSSIRKVDTMPLISHVYDNKDSNLSFDWISQNVKHEIDSEVNKVVGILTSQLKSCKSYLKDIEAVELDITNFI